MSVQKYIVSKEHGNFTVISNHVVTGLKDHLELLGFYLYLLSLPPQWVFHKNQLKETCNIGVKKLEVFLRLLAQTGLIEVAQMRNEKGEFAQFALTVRNGDSFNINGLKESSPCINNRTTVNGSTVKNTYKRNTKENKQKTENKHSCATDVARGRFDDFWSIYPRKKDKARALEIWKRDKLDNSADLMIKDIHNRNINDQSWKDLNYIPHPSTYLKFKRWEDEVNLSVVSPSREKFNPVQYAIDNLKRKGLI